MQKKELIRVVAEDTGCTIKTVETVTDAILDVVLDTAAKGEEIKLVGFGKFWVATRAPHTLRNPSTGKYQEVPETKLFKFSPSSVVKNYLNNKEA